MKPNPLLIAIVLLGVLGGAVWYTRENPPPDRDAAPAIVDLDEDAVRAMTVRRTGEDPVAVVREEEGEWAFGEGVAFRADDSSVGQVVASLASLNAERVVAENVADWAPYGLDEPELAVSYETEAGGGEVSFGGDTPTGSGVFARLRDDPRLFTVYSYNKTAFEKSHYDLRDKRLLSLDEDSIARVEVASESGVVEFAKADGKWSISKPLALRADDFTVSDLVRAVRTAEMTEVLAEDAEGGYSFPSPLATVTVEDGGGAHELVVAQRDDDHYARSSDQEGVYAVSSTLAGSFDKPVHDYRNRKLFDFGFDDPARVDVRVGALTAAVVHDEDKWVLESHEGREAEGVDVQTLLDRLRGLTAKEFPSDREADKARYGLEEPAVEATVTPEGEGAVPETVAVSAPDEARAYAARRGEPSTYEIEQSAVDGLRGALEELLREPGEGEDAEDSDSESDESGE